MCAYIHKLRGRPPPIWRHICCCFCCLLNENTCVVLFGRSMRPVLCLLKRPTKSKTYRAECPRCYVFEFGSKSEYRYSAKVSPKLCFCSADFCIFCTGGGGHPLNVDFVPFWLNLAPFWTPRGSPQCNLQQNYRPKVDLRDPFRAHFCHTVRAKHKQ